MSCALLAASVPLSLLASPSPAHAAQDVTAAVRAGRDVVLSGDTTIRLPGGTTTYGGVFSGQGTLTIAGSGRLVLTADSDFTLPAGRSRQTWSVTGGGHPLSEVHDPDPPAITIARGVTVQYGSGTGPKGVIGHFAARPGLELNTLNIRVDGTLDVAVHRSLHLGIMSGTGLISARRSTWPGLRLAGTHPFTGVIYNGTGTDFASPDFTSALPNLRTVVNQGSWIVDAPVGRRTVLRANLYSRAWGNDINFHSRPGGQVVMTGVYSWADAGPDTAPKLSDPSLNYKTVAHRNNKRGINIEGARVQWGDGTGHRFFLPGNTDTVYINMHAHGPVPSSLTFDYNGPVTLGAPISGGRYHDTLASPGQGDVVIAATPGNAMTFAAPQNYNGTTTIGRLASLTLGSSQGDSNLRGGGPVIDNGTLILANRQTPVVLTGISGRGALKQAGKATTTLDGTITYTGATTVSAGTLALRKGTLRHSAAVALTTRDARLDLSRATDQTLTNLTGAPSSQVLLGSHTMTLVSTRPSTFSGTLTGPQSGLVTKGPALLTLTGDHQGSRWQVDQGELRLNGSTTASVTVAANATLSGTGSVGGDLTTSGRLTTGLRVKGNYNHLPTSSLLTTTAPLTTSGPVTLRGRLTVGADRPPQLTVIDNRSPTSTIGTFAGLPEGAKIPGTAYHITYKGGDGNDVVLGNLASPSPKAETTPLSASSDETAASTQPREHGGSAILIAVILLAAAAIASLFWFRRRRPRPSPRTPTSCDVQGGWSVG